MELTGAIVTRGETMCALRYPPFFHHKIMRVLYKGVAKKLVLMFFLGGRGGSWCFDVVGGLALHSLVSLFIHTQGTTRIGTVP